MHDSIADRVYVLVAEQTGVPVKKLNPATTLSHELGMEGDDAVEFFEVYGREFALDLTRLGADWHCYFSAEGFGLLTGLMVFVPVIILAYGINRTFYLLPFWLAVIVAIVVWFAVMWLWQRFVRKPGPQICVQDLIDCAKGGRWTKTLPDEVKNRSSKSAKYGGVCRWFTS